MLLNVTKKKKKKINPCISVQYLEKFHPKNSISSLHISHGTHQFHCSKSIRLRDRRAFRKEEAGVWCGSSSSSIPTRALLREVTPSSSSQPELCLDSDSDSDTVQSPSTEWDFNGCTSSCFWSTRKLKIYESQNLRCVRVLLFVFFFLWRELSQ